jgi:hypothetical protein
MRVGAGLMYGGSTVSLRVRQMPELGVSGCEWLKGRGGSEWLFGCDIWP